MLLNMQFSFVLLLMVGMVGLSISQDPLNTEKSPKQSKNNEKLYVLNKTKERTSMPHAGPVAEMGSSQSPIKDDNTQKSPNENKNPAQNPIKAENIAQNPIKAENIAQNPIKQGNVAPNPIGGMEQPSRIIVKEPHPAQNPQNVQNGNPRSGMAVQNPINSGMAAQNPMGGDYNPQRFLMRQPNIGQNPMLWVNQNPMLGQFPSQYQMRGDIGAQNPIPLAGNAQQFLISEANSARHLTGREENMQHFLGRGQNAAQNPIGWQGGGPQFLFPRQNMDQYTADLEESETQDPNGNTPQNPGVKENAPQNQKNEKPNTPCPENTPQNPNGQEITPENPVSQDSTQENPIGQEKNPKLIPIELKGNVKQNPAGQKDNSKQNQAGQKEKAPQNSKVQDNKGVPQIPKDITVKDANQSPAKEASNPAKENKGVQSVDNGKNACVETSVDCLCGGENTTEHVIHITLKTISVVDDKTGKSKCYAEEDPLVVCESRKCVIVPNKNFGTLFQRGKKVYSSNYLDNTKDVDSPSAPQKDNSTGTGAGPLVMDAFLSPFFPVEFTYPRVLGEGGHARVARSVYSSNMCRVPTLANSEVTCWKWPNWQTCKQVCIYGHGMESSGKTVREKSFTCRNSENKWKPNSIRDCEPFMNCKVHLKSPGDLNCVEPTDGPAYCDINCADYDDYHSHGKVTWKCEEKAMKHGKHGLPHCAEFEESALRLNPPDY